MSATKERNIRTLFRTAMVLVVLALQSATVVLADEAPAGVPLVSDEAAPPAVVSVFAAIRAAGDKRLNMHRAVANAPEGSADYIGLARTVRRYEHVPRPLRELVILRALQLENGDYEFKWHSRMAQDCGITDAQIAALQAWRTSTLFTTEQRVILG